MMGRTVWTFRLDALIALGLGLSAPVLMSLFFGLASSVDLDVGPGDRDYVQGLGKDWRRDGTTTWREMGRRARLQLPVSLEGPGTLSLRLAQPDPQPVRLEVEFDGGLRREMDIPASTAFHEVKFEIPEERVRAVVRLRSDTETGEPGRLRLDRARWQGRTVLPQTALAIAGVLLLGLTYVSLRWAGVAIPWALAGTLALATILFAVGAYETFALIHLIRRCAPVAGVGLILMGLTRALARRATPAFRGLVYVALLLKSMAVLHPSFYFVDYPLHETLLELVYHRGAADFWMSLPDYQVTHNLGVAPVAGVYQPFPYPVLFYWIAHLGNRLYHDPDLWLKLTGALVSALALLPIGYLARRWLPESRSDLFAGLVYLATPALTRSLLLLELSALTGHLVDLIVVAYLAGIGLAVTSWRRALVTAGLIGASAAAYTSGFIHQGLLVGSILLLGWWWDDLKRGEVLRLALAGLTGAGAALLAYHPTTVLNLFAAVLPAGVEAPATLVPTFTERVGSALARARLFLGDVLPWVGAVSFGLGLRLTPSRPLRLLLSGWALSGAAAFFLRYVFLDLLHFQKELYWAGALLALASGVTVAALFRKRGWGRVAGAAVLLALLVAGLLRLAAVAPLYYRDYRFL